MLKQANDLCSILNKTYNANYLKYYPDIRHIFYDAMKFYYKFPLKFPKANKTLMSLLYNLENPFKQPIVDYITGPGEISKWESTKYNKVIYFFGENDHSNTTGCIQSKINLQGKKHMKIENYLTDLFTHSPVFIDFYVEFGIMLDELENISPTSGQSLWDMLSHIEGCFGPLINRKCPYNARMHGIDIRRILSSKYKSSRFAKMSNTLMMENLYRNKNQSYIEIKDFKKKYKNQIHILSTVKNMSDIIKIIIDDIENNPIINKELKRSTLSKKQIIDFFIYENLNKLLNDIKFSSNKFGQWFKSIKSKELWPTGFELKDNIGAKKEAEGIKAELKFVTLIMTVINAVTVDVYTAARMFKVFNIKENEHYPKEPHNIIYYAGNGHTVPMGIFLQKLGFVRTEHSDNKVLSCTSMEGIKQPLFS